MGNNREVFKYAKAVYDLAEKSDSIEKTLNNLNILFTINSNSVEFRFFIQSRRIQVQDKIVILNKILSNYLSELELDLINCLVENDDIQLLNQIIKQYEVLCRQDQKTINITVTTAEPLGSTLKEEIHSKIEKSLNKKVDLNNLVQSEILGGAKFRVGNTIIDGSISNRLEKLEKSFF